MRQFFIFFSTLSAAVFLLILTQPVHCQDQILPLVRQSAEKIRDRLPLIRATTADCSIPTRWELPLTIPKVENLLTNPIEAPIFISTCSNALMNLNAPSQWIPMFREMMDLSSVLVADTETKIDADFSRLPPALSTPVSTIALAIKKARPLLKDSYANLSEEERDDVMAMHDYPSRSNVNPVLAPPPLKRKIYQAMKKFDQERLFSAAEIIFKSIDEAWPALKQAAAQNLSFDLVRIKTEIGEIIVADRSDHHYSESGISTESLKDCVLLIDLGGKNRYDFPLAGAKEGEIKIAIDFGDDVTIVSTDSVSAGAGIFGIGLLFLPNASGTKTIQTASYSQGMGLFGVGGLFANGLGKFSAEKYAQGTAGFGLGIFANDAGSGSSCEAKLYAQGVGFTRGIGIFRHQGSSAAFHAGLVDPDPREPLGTTSLCQGVGYGPRGYAGGGLGFCLLKGDHLNLESSYFAQGAGYWHGAGAFFLDGNSNIIKARRYDQGSGIHSAAGFFFLNGSENHIINWGVGPAYGWDAGLGWAMAFGDANRFQAEWGSASATYNRSRSFMVIDGNRNRLDLPGSGTASYTRDLPDYAISIIEGDENIFKSPYFIKPQKVRDQFYLSAWGLLDLNSVVISTDAGMMKSEWQSLSRQEASAKAAIDLRQELNKPVSSKSESVERLVRIAAAFSIDKANPREALRQLVLLPDDEIPLLIQQVDPADLEGYIQIRSAVGILGDRAVSAVLDEIAKEKSRERQTWLMSLLPLFKLDKAAPLIFRRLDDEDWRLQAAAARSLSALLNRDQGQAPGRIELLERLADYLDAFFPSKKLQPLLLQMSHRSFAESVSVLSLARDWEINERGMVLNSAPEDIAGNYDSGRAKKVLEMIRKDRRKRKEALDRVRAELKFAESLRGTARKKLNEMLGDLEKKSELVQKKELVYSILIALGNIADERDSEEIGRYLSSGHALVRDAASASLGRIGKASLPVLGKSMRSNSAQDRIQSIVAVQNTTEPSLIEILKMGLNDGDFRVQKISLSTLNQTPPLLSKQRDEMKRAVKKSLAVEKFPKLELERLFIFGE